MSTDYTGIPSIFERVIGAHLIVIGTFGQLLQVEPWEGGEILRVYGIFEVTVDDVLMGDPPASILRLRVVGEGQDEGAAWIAPVTEGGRFLYLLARDVSPNDPEPRYAPCFAGVYPLADDGFVQVPEEAIDDLTRKIAGFDGTQMSLDHVRRLIEFVLQEQEQRQRQMDEMGLGWLRERPYPVNEETPERAEAGAGPADQ